MVGEPGSRAIGWCWLRGGVLLRGVSRLGGHTCCWGYGPNFVGGSARYVPGVLLGGPGLPLGDVYGDALVVGAGLVFLGP